MDMLSHGLVQRNRIAAGILIILYLVGIVSLSIDLHPDFILLTPVNLLISVVLMLWVHPRWSVGFVAFLFACYMWGFLAEMIGVQTGLIFGEYAYGKVLGPKINGTPLMIGVNWILVSYTAGMVVNHFAASLHWVRRALLGSVLLVLLDLLIEPVAITYAFWSWDGQLPPLQNYIGWFLVGLPLQAAFARFFGDQRNIVAVILFILQVVFFATLALINS